MASLRFICVCGLAAIMVQAPLAALAEEPAAPRTIQNGEPVDVAILLSGSGSTPRGESPPMRQPAPLVDIIEWFGPNSRLAQAHIASPAELGYARLTLGIDATGAIGECSLDGSGRLPAVPAAICDDFAGQRFVPALAPDGQRIAGAYSITIMPRRYKVGDPPQPHPLFTKERDPAPVPVMAPRVDRIDSFPPPPFWLRRFYRDPQWQVAPQAGLPQEPSASAQPMTAIVLFDTGAGLDCRIVERSGVTAQDNAACSFARSSLAPAWADASAQDHRAVPLYVTGQGGTSVAYAPDPDFRQTTTLADDVELRFIVALTEAGVFPEGREASPLQIQLVPDAEGRVAHCRIVTSTGTDAGDIAACRIARETIVMQPMEDIFGRTSPYASLFWKAAPADE